jgi:hypothetical protein
LIHQKGADIDRRIPWPDARVPMPERLTQNILLRPGVCFCTTGKVAHNVLLGHQTRARRPRAWFPANGDKPPVIRVEGVPILS